MFIPFVFVCLVVYVIGHLYVQNLRHHARWDRLVDFICDEHPELQPQVQRIHLNSKVK